MKSVRCRVWMMGVLAACGLAAGPVLAQVSSARFRSLASNVVMPQRRAFAVGRRAAVEITGVKVGVVILEQAATTTMEISLRNPSGSRQEAELLVPVPDGAVVRGFTFQGAAKEPTAELLVKEEARRTYAAIVAKIRDPALLEFVGYNLIRSSVFPVEPKGTQKVRLTYDHLLPAEGDRVDYLLPRSEAIDYTIPWQVSVRITSRRSISTVYSPTHQLETARTSAKAVSVRIARDSATEPGPFRLSYLLERGGVSATLFAYPDPKVGGGYFLLLAGLPAKPPTRNGEPAIKREVILVFDRSGSMGGEKIDQVREAAFQILEGLEDGEAFNIIVYNAAVERFAAKPVIKTRQTVKAARAYLKNLKAQGGTNLHDALLEALRQKPAKGMLPIVLFLTDGLPTIGQTSEVAIRNVAMKANRYDRRVFTFGVGVDVNTPLLDKIAVETRAVATFVLPKEDVEVKVAGVFKRLAGPVLAGPAITVDRPGSAMVLRPAHDLMPAKLPDLFEGDQLVVLGKYRGEEPLTFTVTGNYLGEQRTFHLPFTLERATVKNGFVPRLWASRRIAMLTDAIRALGADAAPAQVQRRAATDPRIKELVDEIVRLSTEFGILTEYTAFLAKEGTDLSDRDRVLAAANANYVNRAMSTRLGIASVNQERNNRLQRGQMTLNRRNSFLDERMNRVQVLQVQQVNDRAFYRRGRRWVDSRLVEQERTIKPTRVIEFGSKEFAELLVTLAKENRQGTVALHGDILLVVDGTTVLVKGPVKP